MFESTGQVPVNVTVGCDICVGVHTHLPREHHRVGDLVRKWKSVKCNSARTRKLRLCDTSTVLRCVLNVNKI
jgi:hypothetical protein